MRLQPDCKLPSTIFAAAFQARTSKPTSFPTSFSTLFELRNDSPQLSISSSNFASASALLDTAATCDYVSSRFAKQHSLPLSTLSNPLSIHYADGSSRTELITHSTTIPISLPSGPAHEVTFFVTPLRTHDFFLGLPWYLRHQAVIDFASRTLTYSVCSNSPTSNSNHASRPTTPSSPNDTSNPTIPTNLPHASNTQGPDPADAEVMLSASERQNILGSILTDPEPLLRTAQVRSASSSTPTSASSDEDADIRSTLPEVYHNFVDVFRKTLADKLPQHRSYDHSIPLVPNTTPPFGPIYSLTEKELRELRSYLNENLAKGFIRPSSSPAGAPVLFVPKSDGSLRLCVDYRGLNNITVKDRYAIPKIDDLLDRIRGSTIFTKIDLRGAYNLLRIFQGEEWKTAFRTRFGSFEYLVMPFGLCNAPSSFQRFMNDIFSDMVDVFVVIYLDDILIFSKTRREHEAHVKKVLERLRRSNLYAKAEKCEFSRDSVEFLGYELSKDGVHMVTDKVASVLSWPAPKTVKELQSFLGFANFYRRFIWKYSAKVAPLTALLRKNQVWRWDEACQAAFDQLKEAFTSAPVLQHFDPSKSITLETDASDYAIAAVASQPDSEGRLRPVAYRSRKMNPAELNYEIHDKEMLAIVDALREWRHMLQDSRHTVTILTDHKNLEYFTTSKMLNRRQARWAELLTEYDFKIVYRPGREGGKPDALTRRPDYHPGTASHLYADHNPHNNVVLLPNLKHDFDAASNRPEIHERSFQSASNQPASVAPDKAVARVAHAHALNADFEPHETSSQPAAPDSCDPASNRLEGAALDEAVARVAYALNADLELREQFFNAYASDPLAQSLLTKPSKDYSVSEDGILFYKSRFYVPESLRVSIIKSRHDHILAGHPGRRKTLSLLRRDYFWPKMRSMVEDYVDTCDACARTKIPRHKPYGLLKSLPVPSGPWQDISMDFIEALPLSNGFDCILVIVDRLTKMSLFIPTHSTVTSQDLAELYLQHVFSKHGRPKTIVSDRGTEFTSSFWRSFCQLLDIEQSLSTAYHPQTDGQTERVNQNLEQYLRLFTSYQQDDWSSLLPLAEFVYNNTEHSTTGCSPFFANKGYHPLFDITPERVRDSPAAHPDANERAARLAIIHQRLQADIAEANEASKTAYDRKHSEAPTFAVGDQVMLSARNIRSTRPTRKLDNRSLGPFKITARISSHAYRLELPPSMHIHNVFHVSLLEPHRANTIPGRTQNPPPPIEVDGDIQYEVERIVDSKFDRRYGCQLRYRVEWSGYTGEDRFTWEGADQLSCPRHIEDFHRRYPDKPGPL